MVEKENAKEIMGAFPIAVRLTKRESDPNFQIQFKITGHITYILIVFLFCYCHLLFNYVNII